MNRFLLIAISFAFIVSSFGQSKSQRKKNKIKSVTEWETIITEGNTSSFKSAFEEYDRSGRNIQKIEYGSDGTILHKETTIYDIYGNKTEETEMDVEKHKNIRRTFKYNALKDKTEEMEYSVSGGLLKKTLFTYDANGNKISETVFDASGNCLKKIRFTYNSKSLKTKKEIYRGMNQQESVKKWDYVYF